MHVVCVVHGVLCARRVVRVLCHDVCVCGVCCVCVCVCVGDVHVCGVCA